MTANTPTGITGDDQYAYFGLSFPFTFYNNNYSSVYISSNGFMSFVNASVDWTPDPIPSTNPPNNLVAGLWRDLNPAAGGCTNACVTYSSSTSQFVASYNNVKNYSGTNRQTFQMLLNSDGSIIYQYASVTNDVTTSIGVENQSGTVGTAYSSPPSNGLAIKFTPNVVTTVLQDLTYSYDNAGNITGITDNLEPSRSQSFTYDELNRLHTATSASYATITYDYTEIGNIQSNSQIGTYIYGGLQPHAVTQAGANIYGYDLNGNMTSGPGRTIAYNYDNMPSSVNSTSFVYDYKGQRVKKTTNSVSTVYIGSLYECTSGACTKYIFGGSQRIASKTGSTIYYYHSDHLGSSSIMTDVNAAKVEEIYYFPFGATRYNSGSINVKHKFTGQEEDGETGLYYYGARYYDPAIGRFISPDSIVPDPGDPQSLNRYTYVLNNPLLYTDPTGHCWWDACIVEGAIIGAAIGGTVAAVTGGNILQGMATGAITGAFTGGASGVISSSAAATGQALSSITQAGIYTAAGGMAGATNAAIFGADIGQGALIGGAFGFASYAIGTPNFKLFGNSAAGSIANRIFNSALTGSAFGAAYAGMTGGDIGQGAAMGALGWAAGEAGSMLIGHAAGYLLSGEGPVAFENGYFIYDFKQDYGYATLSNVVIGDASTLWNVLTNPFDPRVKDPLGRSVLKHEMGHGYPQGTAFGPGYIPAQLLSMGVGGVIGMFTPGYGFYEGTSQFSFLEVFFHPVPYPAR